MLLWRFLLSSWQVPQGKTASSTLTWFFFSFFFFTFSQIDLACPSEILTRSVLLSTSLVCPASLLLDVLNWPSGNCLTCSGFFYLNLYQNSLLAFFPLQVFILPSAIGDFTASVLNTVWLVFSDLLIELYFTISFQKKKKKATMTSEWSVIIETPSTSMACWICF